MKGDYNMNYRNSSLNTQDPLLRTISIPEQKQTVYIACPHCGEVAEVDISEILTSYPPQYRYSCLGCKHTGYIFCEELSSKRIKPNFQSIEIPETEYTLCVDCLICGAPVPSHRSGYEVAICDDCKKAILKLRKMLESKDND